MKILYTLLPFIKAGLITFALYKASIFFAIAYFVHEAFTLIQYYVYNEVRNEYISEIAELYNPKNKQEDSDENL